MRNTFASYEVGTGDMYNAMGAAWISPCTQGPEVLCYVQSCKLERPQEDMMPRSYPGGNRLDRRNVHVAAAGTSSVLGESTEEVEEALEDDPVPEAAPEPTPEPDPSPEED